MSAMVGLDKKRLFRELERDRRAALRKRLGELRALIKVARATRREAVAGIKLQCKIARGKLRGVCAGRVVKAKARGAQAVEAGGREIVEARATDRQHRAADRHGVAKARRSSSSERRAESDDEVRSNIDPELREVFERVRKHIKPHARKSRTESFLEWAEENPSEVYAIQSEHAERGLARLIAEHEKAERLAHSRRKLAAGEVPF
jgi:hypothetical protein